MAASDLTRKLASLGIIAVLLGVSAWLRPVQAPEWLPSHRAFPIIHIPHRLDPASDRPGSGVRAGLNRGQTRVRAGSAYGFGAARTAGIGEGRQLPIETSRGGAQRETAASIRPLASRAIVRTGDLPPVMMSAASVSSAVNRGESAGDPVADAFATAGRQTGSAFRTGVAHTGGAFVKAGRAIRSIF